MRLPAGTVEGIITNPKKEGLLQDLLTFKGLIETETPSGHGFILINNGTLVSAYFKNAGALFRGQSALAPLNMGSEADFLSPQTLNVRKYTDDEYSRAVQISLEEDLIIHEPGASQGEDNEDLYTDKTAERPEPLDETKLKKIKGLAGVIAVAAFYEGFAIQSLGDADLSTLQPLLKT